MNKKFKALLVIFSSIAVWLTLAIILPSYTKLIEPENNKALVGNILIVVSIICSIFFVYGVVLFFKKSRK